MTKLWCQYWQGPEPFEWIITRSELKRQLYDTGYELEELHCDKGLELKEQLYDKDRFREIELEELHCNKGLKEQLYDNG